MRNGRRSPDQQVILTPPPPHRLGLNLVEINIYLNINEIYVFVKILSQWRRRKEDEISILRSARGKLIALKKASLGVRSPCFLDEMQHSIICKICSGARLFLMIMHVYSTLRALPSRVQICSLACNLDYIQYLNFKSSIQS